MSDDSEPSKPADALAAAIEAAINEHVGAKGGVPMGYIAAVNFMDGDGSLSWSTVAMDGQSPIVTHGLTEICRITFEAVTHHAIFCTEHHDGDDG